MISLTEFPLFLRCKSKLGRRVSCMRISLASPANTERIELSRAYRMVDPLTRPIQYPRLCQLPQVLRSIPRSMLVAT